MGITIAILTYNEEENIKLLLPLVIKNLEKVSDDFEIIVVDSQKSKDNTKAICEKYGVKYYIQEGQVFTDAFKTAIKHANKEFILYIDADFSHNPEDIPSIYNAFIENDADIVIGSRYVNGGKNEDYKINIIFSIITNFIFKIISGRYDISDISAGYKMYKTKILKNIDIVSHYFEMQLEIFTKANIQNPDLKVIEIPIHFKKREKGCSKRNYFQYLPRFLMIFIYLLFYKIKK